MSRKICFNNTIIYKIISLLSKNNHYHDYGMSFLLSFKLNGTVLNICDSQQQWGGFEMGGANIVINLNVEYYIAKTE